MGGKPITSAKGINRLKASGQSNRRGASSVGQTHIETVAKHSAITGDQTETSNRVHTITKQAETKDGEITSDQTVTNQAAACGQPAPKLLNTNETLDYRLPQSNSEEAPAPQATLRNDVINAIDAIKLCSRSYATAFTGIHARVLRNLTQKDPLVTPSIDGSNLDGPKWIDILEAGTGEHRKRTVFVMLEYMGASEWYNSEIERVQPTLCTKKKQPVDRKGAAMHVLNTMLAIQHSEVDEGRKSDPAEVSLQASQRMAQRKRISTQLARGDKLCNTIVKELGLGILFSSKIW